MLLDAPSWAGIKSANAAHLAMIAAWIGSIGTVIAASATVVAAIYAIKAARYAKKAADKSEEQVTAAKESVVAARAEIVLMERQMKFAEPRPVLLLTLRYVEGDASIVPVCIQIENVGDALAFDIQVHPIIVRAKRQSSGGFSAEFESVPVLRPGSSKDLTLSVSPTLITPTTNQQQNFMELLIRSAIASAPTVEFGSSEKFVAASTFVKFKNVRGRSFNQSFLIVLQGEKVLSGMPQGTLLGDCL